MKEKYRLRDKGIRETEKEGGKEGERRNEREGSRAGRSEVGRKEGGR